jgi:hypothetical protein
MWHVIACRGGGEGHDPLDYTSCMAMEVRALTQQVKITLRWAHEHTAFPPTHQEEVDWCRLHQADAKLDDSAEVWTQLLHLSKHLATRQKQVYVPSRSFKVRVWNPYQGDNKTASSTSRVASAGVSAAALQLSTAGRPC